MSIALIEEIETFLAGLKAKLSPEQKAAVKDIQNEGHAVVTDAATYIKANALQDLEQIAVGVLTSIASGTPWGAVLTAVEQQAVSAGKSILAGSVAVVTAKAQADLMAVGTIPTPAPAA